MKLTQNKVEMRKTKIKWKIWKIPCKMADLNLTLSIMTVSGNSLKTLIKRQML